MSEVIAFWSKRTYKLVDFTSPLKLGLRSVGEIYFVCGILENSMTSLYGNKVADLIK